ncbi:hypothetical protein [Rubritalea tangerina]|uniref:hypothetical protein n=1 Tax=Rubritalea tangerina TaxID=430798 RepID=UPI00361D30B5
MFVCLARMARKVSCCIGSPVLEEYWDNSMNHSPLGYTRRSNIQGSSARKCALVCNGESGL